MATAAGALIPPFTRATAIKKVKMAQHLWNTMNPAKVSLAYTEDSIWRNRTTFVRGHAEIEKFLTDKWAKESEYKLRKELFAFCDNKIAVQFWYEWLEKESGQWYRTYGLEDWTFAADGRMEKRHMSGNDLAISDGERWFKPGVDIESVELGPQHF
ncbi:uncharacterized protein V1518DRAFT_420810 [Limtongia smithiae]|uniref:uncharacterized protein n=1 Tax=Limtongia smithiae TaxID=1125753 RepID=UPI0034CF44F1